MNEHYGYLGAQVLRNTLASGMSPRQSEAFFTSIGFTPMGGSWRKHKTRKGNTASRLATVSKLLPTPRRNGFSVSARSKTMAHAKNPSVEACRSLFGEHPEDVIAPINSASDTLYWLEEIFKTISREALDARAGYRIKHLAEAGAYLAFDIANFTDCQHETMIDRLRNAGVVHAKGATA